MLSKIKNLAFSYSYSYSHNFPIPPKDNNPKQILNFIKNNYAKIKQDQISFAMYRKWLNQKTPIIASNHKMLSNFGYYELFSFIQKIGFHRSIYFQLVQENMHTQRNLQLISLVKVYDIFVNFKHPSNPELLIKLRKIIVKKFKELQVIPINLTSSFFLFVYTLFLDRSIQLSEKQAIVQQLSTFLSRSLQVFQKKIEISIFTLKSIYQQTQIYKINLNPQFLAFLLKAKQIFEKNERKFCEQRNYLQSQSIFQKNISKRLAFLGYRFDTNVFMMGNQYDVIVSARDKQKYCPLKGFNLDDNLQNHPAINLQLVRQYANSPDIQYIHKTTILPHKVVLNLNGPLHYIDSDILPKNTISRKQQFKYEKLALYGINHYSIINYKQWEQSSKFDKVVDMFLRDQIYKPLLVSQIGK